MAETQILASASAPVAVPHRIASLDGLRGISIWAVLMAHIADHYFEGPRYSYAIHRTFSSIASAGVNTFFVISGFLITFLLLKEERRTSTIKLSNFYRRRAIRILPAFLLYFLVVLVFGHPSSPQIVYAATFTTSYFFDQAYRPLQQLWTLSVEEQFYLLWPLLMLLGGSKFARKACWIALFAVPLLRVIFVHEQLYTWMHSAPLQADAIVAGCLLAFYFEPMMAFSKRYLIATPRFIALALVTSLFAIASYWFHVVSCQGVASVMVALVIAAAIERKDGWLNHGPLVWSGLLSYSLYLWQQPLLVFGGPFDHLYVRLPLAFLAAWLSYRLVEQPILRLASSARPVPKAELAETT